MAFHFVPLYGCYEIIYSVVGNIRISVAMEHSHYYGKLLQTSGIKIHRHRAYNSFPRMLFRASRFNSRNSYRSCIEIAPVTDSSRFTKTHAINSQLLGKIVKIYISTLSSLFSLRQFSAECAVARRSVALSQATLCGLHCQSPFPLRSVHYHHAASFAVVWWSRRISRVPVP